MRILFIHQNFPGQFPHIARHLATDPNNEVIAICQKQAPKLAGIHCITYAPNRPVTKGILTILQARSQPSSMDRQWYV